MILPAPKEQKEWLTNQLEAVKNENLSHYLQKKMNEVEIEVLEAKDDLSEKDEDTLEYHKKNIKSFDKIMEVNDKKITLLEEMIAKL